MVYDGRVSDPDGEESRFELRRDEPLKVGDFIRQGTMVYTVRRILPHGSDQFDAHRPGGMGRRACARPVRVAIAHQLPRRQPTVYVPEFGGRP